ncbi:hypothetical protein JAAARDRAFT_539314 [Jaapia argillacea MUCL 33604]|uniref:Uncharacterized protein n=1 Tax=Jaapia argillacea MUCL 33604 TaxID=933084 RepID=A0A067PJF4_9AGAM|nr:hypothetical protein JAAARDRAFT_539314 [Jaapia argillacea MUCL 33604]
MPFPSVKMLTAFGFVVSVTDGRRCYSILHSSYLIALHQEKGKSTLALLEGPSIRPSRFRVQSATNSTTRRTTISYAPCIGLLNRQCEDDSLLSTQRPHVSSLDTWH